MSNENNEGLGLATVGLAHILFGVAAVVVKLQTLPLLQLVQLRLAAQLFFAVPLATLYRPPGTPLFGAPAVRPYLIARAAAQWTLVLLWWSALAYLPIGEATSIVFMGPLWATLFSVVLLKERCLRVFPLQAAMCTLGVLLIAQPEKLFTALGITTGRTGSQDRGDSQLLGMLCALGASLAGGIGPVIVRLCGDTHWSQFEVVTSSFNGFILTPLAVLVQYCVLLGGGVHGDEGAAAVAWRWTVEGTLLALSIGAILLVALILHTKGYQMATPSRSSMVAYIEIPFSLLVQWLGFNEAPNALCLVGSGLILLSLPLPLVCRHSDVAAESDVKFAPLPTAD